MDWIGIERGNEDKFDENDVEMKEKIYGEYQVF